MTADARALLLLVAFLINASAAFAAERTQVLLVGTYHFSNPGQDLNNVEAVDVLLPERQKELEAVTDALARFAPTFVGVEWPHETVTERYAKYVAGTLPESRNEVVQLGFRLARQRGLAQVHGLDMQGDLGFDALFEWAKANGRQSVIDALFELGRKETAKISELQRRTSLGGVLRYMNEPAQIALNHSAYVSLLPLGAGDTQPGANVVASWHARNLKICARLLQAVKPGDRAVVFFGQGHIYLLHQCLSEVPEVELVDPLRYLPKN